MRAGEMTPYLRQKIVGMYADGYTQVEIREKFNCSQTTISRVCIEAGVNRKPSRGPRVKPHDQGSPCCGVCREAYHYTTDRIYGATLETCRCGGRTLENHWRDVA